MNQTDTGVLRDAAAVHARQVAFDLFIALVEADRFSRDDLFRQILASAPSIGMTEAQVGSFIDVFLASGGLI